MSEKKPRAAQSVSDMVRSLGAVGLLVGLLATFVWFTRTESEQVLREVDWKSISIGAQTRTQLPTLGPVGLDKSWVATSARLEEIGEEDVWRVGVVSPSTEFVSVIVSKAESGNNILIYSTANWDETTKFVESLKVPTK